MLVSCAMTVLKDSGEFNGSNRAPRNSNDTLSLTPLTTSPALQTTYKPMNTMASATAQRRLLQEYRALTNNPPEGITAGPVSEDDLLYWEALIQGPEGTPFEGGVFPAELKFPKDYPLAPPSMRFLGEVWHPNGLFPFPFTAPYSCNFAIGGIWGIWLMIMAWG